VGITGTNGKTTTATILHKILLHSGVHTGFIGTGKILIGEKQISDKRYSMTTPDPHVLYKVIKEMETDGCRIIVMEVSSHALYFDKVAPIIFDIGVFTNFSSEHMDFHKNTENYFNAKLKLFTQCKNAIFNMDNKHCRTAYEKAECKKTAIGIIWDAPITAREIEMRGFSGSEYIYQDSKRIFKVKLRLGGAYNIYNSMLAIAAAIELGIAPCEAKKAVSKISEIDGRLEVVNDSVTVIIDYAHTEDALLNVLKFIKSNINMGQKLITVFGCGGERDKTKRPKMGKIAEEISDLVIVTTDNSRHEAESEIIKDILSGFKGTAKRKVITSRTAAIEYAILSANDGDVIAVIGKGHERYNIDKFGYSDFDERTIIYNAIKRRKGEILIENENCAENSIKA
jgi:UDP-N-acetylmuramoyl-L-alanyl-D-glutamate--2,6-diaminopimelate ligase